MILSDKQIKQLSTTPTAFIYDHGKAIPCWGNQDEIDAAVKSILSIYPMSDDRLQVYASRVVDAGDNRFKPMISPFHPELVRVETKALGLGDLLHNKLHPHEEPKTPDRKFVISYGTSSYGYDVRLDKKFKIFTNVVHNGVVDPKNFDAAVCHDIEADEVIIPPNGFLLGSTVEYIRMPRNVTGVVLGKSTYARCGIVCIATPLEAGWEGQVTLEFANTTPNPVKMYAGEGAAQILFFQGEDCETSYADRNGKYQGQLGITLPTA